MQPIAKPAFDFGVRLTGLLIDPVIFLLAPVGISVGSSTALTVFSPTGETLNRFAVLANAFAKIIDLLQQ